jgi:hypothetical protein
VLVVGPHRGLDHLHRRLRPTVFAHLRRLAFQLLVVLEEHLQLRQPVLRQVVEVVIVAVLRVVAVDADDLLVALALVHQRQHADRLGAQDRQRRHRLLHQHQHVQRVAVVAQRLRDEAVVGGVEHRAVQHAVDAQEAGVLVQLVLDLAPLGDLDHGLEPLRGVRAHVDIVPCMRHARDDSARRRPPAADW